MVEPSARQARHRRRDAHRARTGACALLGRLRSVARAGPVLEVPRRRAAVRIDGSVERRGRHRDARRRAGDGDRRRGRGEDSVGASSRAGAVRRDHPVVVGRAGREAGEGGGHRGVGRARPGVHVRGLRAVARARPVLDVPGRRLAVRIDRPRHGRRGRADRGDRAGDRRRRHGRCAPPRTRAQPSPREPRCREVCGCSALRAVVTTEYPPLVKTVQGDWKGSVRARLTADDPRERRRQDDGPLAARRAALAIAGPYVAGGVGVHETALASPDVVDLGGRCVLPAFTDSHVHFPTWSLAQRQVKLDGCASLDEALARVRDAEIAPGRWLRGYGWRDGDWSPGRRADEGGARRGHRRDADDLISKDYHSAWLNSAALAPPAATSTSTAASSSGTSAASRRASCARSPPGASASATSSRPRTSGSRRRAPGSSSRLARRHGRSTTRTAGSARRLFQRLRDEGNLSLRVWGSIPHELARPRGRALAQLGLRRRPPAARLPEVLHGRDARLADRAAHRRHGRARSPPARSSRRSSGAAPSAAGRSPSTRSATRRTATRSTRSRRRRTPGSPRACATGSSTRSASRPRTSPASPSSASPARCSSRTRPRTATSPSASGPTGSRARTRSARCSTPAPSSRTARMRRSRSSTRSPASPPASSGRSTTGPPGGRRRR